MQTPSLQSANRPLAFSSAANLTPADGNGRLGAMVFGGTVEERLQLNESTLWGGAPHDNANPEAGPRLAELRRLIFEGNISKANNLGAQCLADPLVNGPINLCGAYPPNKGTHPFAIRTE